MGLSKTIALRASPCTDLSTPHAFAENKGRAKRNDQDQENADSGRGEKVNATPDLRGDTPYAAALPKQRSNESGDHKRYIFEGLHTVSPSSVLSL
jgi:hypothetical protein